MIVQIFNRIQEKVGEFGASIILLCCLSLLMILLLFLVFKLLDKIRKKEDDESKGFNERYPKVFGIILLLFLLIMGLLAIWFVEFLVTSIVVGVIWLADKVSKLDALIIVALITGTISIVSNIVVKIIEYRKRKLDFLAQKREQPYEELLLMYYKIQDNTKNPGSYPDEEMIKDVYKCSKGITLWGSKKVVKKWFEFRKLVSSGKTKEMMNIIEKLMNEMRKDVGTKSVKERNVLALTINDIKNYLK